MVRRSTWIVLGLFILLVGFALYFQRYQANKVANEPTATPTLSPEYLYNLGDAQIDNFKITDNTGNYIQLYRDPVSLKWAIEGVPADTANSTLIASASGQLAKLQVEQTITDTLPLATIGLDTPSYTITLTTSAGSQLVTYVGLQTAIGTGYYIKDETGKIMIVNKSIMDDILKLLITPPLMPTATPEITTTEVATPAPTIGQATPTP